MSIHQIPVALEIGQKRVFASAVDWPGWTRGGRDETSALETLLLYGPRYAQAIQAGQLGFQAPTDLTALTVVERLTGNATTDFGAPDMPPALDLTPLDDLTQTGLQAVMSACWASFGAAIEAAQGRALRTGPRGGGRDLVKMFEHVVDAHLSYLGRINWKAKRDPTQDMLTVLAAIQRETAAALAAAGDLPATGPRGGVLWRPRYFVRRAAWHILDHVWEIEDRID